MTIYVDALFDWGKQGKWCHMWTDGDPEELHAFASSIGLQPQWFQKANLSFLHYDLRPSKRELALKKGAEFMPLRDWIKANPIRKRMREGVQ